ncbi:MAG TPA: fused MFS/spermidine synthase, partial [Burkholderiales bacterium]|nr:fused MFS/spermidine synthase [Burkholderiales bacterium]
EIVEEDGVRVLQIGGDAIQSAMRLSAPDAIELDYVRAMMAFLLFRPAPRDVLMVGLGGGSMARFIHARMPETRVVVAEINPGVVTVARKYFRLPGEDERLEIVIGDGAEEVARRPSACDVLVVDGFVNGRVAGSLCTRSFYACALSALRPQGVLVANFMADDAKLERHCARIEKAFGRPPVLLLAEEQDNLIAFAVRDGPSRIAWARLRERARDARARLGLRLEECLAPLKERNPGTARYLEI